MADFNQVLEPGDYKNGNINVVIEIPTGSNHKIEWDRKRARLFYALLGLLMIATAVYFFLEVQTAFQD